MRNEKAPIAVEGYPFIGAAAFLFLFFFFLKWKILAGIFLVVTLFILFFFRNPRRKVPQDESQIVAPADGVIIYLGPATEPHLNVEMTKISIFMSVFNVHVNRIPVTGTIRDRFYAKGKFLDVRDARATFENERSGIVIETARGLKIVVVQVAGLIARRIICYPAVGELQSRGQIYGLIRFGSRLDVYLPANVDITVAMGQKTVAGETVLGIVQ